MKLAELKKHWQSCTDRKNENGRNSKKTDQLIKIINESDYVTKTSVRKTDTEYCNKLEKLVQVNAKNLYMFKNNPCHMSYFGVLLLEVYYLRGENHV